MMQFTISLALMILSISIQNANCEIFTSIDDMTDLYDTETAIIDRLTAYIKSHESRLKYIKERLQEYKQKHKEAEGNAFAYVSNPVNAFLLTKRLTVDLEDLNTVMKQKIDPSLRISPNKSKPLKFPSFKDLEGSAVAITRLQDTYDLDTHSIVNGTIKGILNSSYIFTASDCYSIGYFSYKADSFKYATYWLEEAFKLFDDRSLDKSKITKINILGQLAKAHVKLGNVTNAMTATRQMLTLQPFDEVARSNMRKLKKKFLEAVIEKENVTPSDRPTEITDDLLEDKEWMERYGKLQQKIYKQLCRKEIEPTPEQLAPLRCRYVYGKSPFLKIAPLKLEEQSLTPYIVTYHEVITDKEIKVIKNLAKPKLMRAGVHASGEITKDADYRISKLTWMKDEHHKYIRDISKRVEDMTGLTTSTAEELQVLNYGIGGHYEPHLDFGHPVNYTDENNGLENRIATVLFYMSDVAEGGATVFPLIRLALWPRKGSAAFWYNLHASGQGNLLTKHAGCPVFIGSKWICNKWIHVRKQELRRPCELEPDHPWYMDED